MPSIVDRRALATLLDAPQRLRRVADRNKNNNNDNNRKKNNNDRNKNNDSDDDGERKNDDKNDNDDNDDDDARAYVERAKKILNPFILRRLKVRVLIDCNVALVYLGNLIC